MKLIKKVKKYTDDRESRISLPAERVQEIIKKHNVNDWFLYAFTNRGERRHVCEPSLWVLNNLPKESVIFETGCGCGLNLIWFAQKGYTHLLGSDISREVILAGKEIARLAHADIELWQDDGLIPARLPDKIDVLLALNWTYHVDKFDLKLFLCNYTKNVNSSGYLIIEVIDISYNNTPDNQYLTSDWAKPIEERKPSEYKIRYSYEQVASIVKDAGCKIHYTITIAQVIPRVVYILRKI